MIFIGVGSVVGLIVGGIVFVVIFGSISNEFNSLDRVNLIGVENDMFAFLDVLPMFIIVVVVLVVLFGLFDFGYVEADDGDKHFKIKRKVKVDPVYVAKMRYVNGEITREEYTEIMSRL